MNKRIYSIIASLANPPKCCGYPLSNASLAFPESLIVPQKSAGQSVSTEYIRYRRKQQTCFSKCKDNKSVASSKQHVDEKISLNAIQEYNLEIVYEQYKSKLDKALKKYLRLCHELKAIQSIDSASLTDDELKELLKKEKKLQRQIRDSCSHVISIHYPTRFDIPSTPICKQHCDKTVSNPSSNVEYKERKRMLDCNRAKARKMKYAERDFWTKQWEGFEYDDTSSLDLTKYEYEQMLEELRYINDLIHMLSTPLQTVAISDETAEAISQELADAKKRKIVIERNISNIELIRSVLG